MDKKKMSNIVYDVKKTIGKHSPGILTGLGIAGMVLTTVLAIKATPKAVNIIEKEQKHKYKELQNNPTDECLSDRKMRLTPIEVIKVTWKCYLPSAVTCATSIVCLAGANTVSVRHNAALTAAYKLSETALHEYKDAVVETVGEDEEKNIRQHMNEKRLSKDVSDDLIIESTCNGTTKCYDVISGRYFYCDIEHIRKSENTINRQLLDDMFVSLNELYDEIGLTHNKMGNLLGWDVDDGLIKILFSSKIDDHGEPCIVVDYEFMPKSKYDQFTGR